MEKNECTFHWTWRSKSKTWLLLMKSWMSKAKTWMLHKWKLNIRCKKVESRVQTEMTNTKCRIDFANYNMKWNIEFWRKWNAIVDVCLHASKANKCASVSGKPFYYVKKCLIYTSRDSHAGCFWMSASAKKVITEDSKVTPQSYEGANCDLPFQLIISHG